MIRHDGDHGHDVSDHDHGGRDGDVGHGMEPPNPDGTTPLLARYCMMRVPRLAVHPRGHSPA